MAVGIITIVVPHQVARQVVNGFKPGQSLTVMDVALRFEPRGFIHGTNMQLHQWPMLTSVTLPGERGAAIATEGALDAG